MTFVPFLWSSSAAMTSGLPPRRMSVPRPAMFVAIVTAPGRPACATISASRSWSLALRTLCLIPRRFSISPSISLTSTLIVPTRTGRPFSCSSAISSTTAFHLPFCAGVDEVGVVVADHVAVGRDDDDLEVVDLRELLRLGLGRAGHAGELVVHAEVVLERDRGQRPLLAADLDALLGLDGLVQALRPAATGHEAPGELVDDDHLAVLDDVVAVALVEHLRLQRLLEVARQAEVVGEHVVDAEPALHLVGAGLGDRDLLELLVDDVVLLGLQPRDEPRELDVLVGRLLRLAADDERRPRLVDEDVVDLVDDRVEVAALRRGWRGRRRGCRAGSRSRTRCSCRTSRRPRTPRAG